MSTFDHIYLGMVIAGMVSLPAALAWAVLITRGPRKPETPVQEPVTSEPERRRAA